MLIESILKRAKGTFVDIDGVTYHFVPASGRFTDPHVATVTDVAHIERFLSIPEGYRIADDQPEAEPVTPPAPPVPQPAAASVTNVIDPLAATAATTAAKTDDTVERATVADLRARYRATFGTPATKNMTREDLEAALAAAPKQE